MKRRCLIPVLACLLALAGLSVHAGPNAHTAKLLSGNYDFKTPLKYLHALIIIRQENNRFPGVYGGRNDSGKFSLIAREDALTDALTLASTGGFAVRISYFPPRQGMDELVPGQVWGKLGKDAKVLAEFASFKDWKRVNEPRRDAEGTTLEATFTGTFKANGKATPITGTGTFFVPHRVGIFRFSTSFTINGAELGLPATQSGPLSVSLKTISPASADVPTGAPDLLEIEGKD